MTIAAGGDSVIVVDFILVTFTDLLVAAEKYENKYPRTEGCRSKGASRTFGSFSAATDTRFKCHGGAHSDQRARQH